jgi:hypothetical protein
VLEGDTVVLNTGAVTATFASKLPGVHSVAVDGYTISGADSLNYTLDNLALISEITKRTIVISGVLTADDKEYDANKEAVVDGIGIENKVDDNVQFTDLKGEFDKKDVGANITVHLTNLVLNGSDKDYYDLPDTWRDLTAAASITKRPLTANNLTFEKDYDETTERGNSWLTGYEMSGLQGGEGAAIDIGNYTTFLYASPDIGENIGITFPTNSITVVSDDPIFMLDNYNWAQPTAAIGKILDRKSLFIAGLGVKNKTYDGTNEAELTGDAVLRGVLPGDDVTFDTSGLYGEFTDKHAGYNRGVTLGGFTLGGEDVEKYHLVMPDLAAVIYEREVRISNTEIADKVYDGTITASFKMPPTPQNIVHGDDIVLNCPTLEFVQKNVGSNLAVILRGEFTLGGEYSDSYRVKQPTINPKASITAAQLKIPSITFTKQYDSTPFGNSTNTQIATISISGLVGEERAKLDLASNTIVFPDAEIGTYPRPDFIEMIVINGALTLRDTGNTGFNGANYSISDPQNISGLILGEGQLTIGNIMALGKVYDGTPDAFIEPIDKSEGYILLGILRPDDENSVCLESQDLVGTYVDSGDGLRSDAGDGITVQIDDVHITDSCPVGVPLSTSFATPFDEPPIYLPPTDSPPPALDPVVDPLIPGDQSDTPPDPTDLPELPDLPDPWSPGISVPTALNDYTFVQPPNLLADIYRRSVAIEGVKVKSKIYDGTSSASFESKPHLKAGDVVGDDDVSLDESAGVPEYIGRNVSAFVLAQLPQFKLNGKSAKNYAPNQAAYTMGAITPAEVTIAAKDLFKLYGEEDPEWTATVENVDISGSCGTSLCTGDVLIGDLSREPGEDRGEYLITASEVGVYDSNEGANYNLTLKGGVFAIGDPCENGAINPPACDTYEPDPIDPDTDPDTDPSGSDNPPDSIDPEDSDPEKATDGDDNPTPETVLPPTNPTAPTSPSNPAAPSIPVDPSTPPNQGDAPSTSPNPGSPLDLPPSADSPSGTTSISSTAITGVAPSTLIILMIVLLLWGSVVRKFSPIKHSSQKLPHSICKHQKSVV